MSTSTPTTHQRLQNTYHQHWKNAYHHCHPTKKSSRMPRPPTMKHLETAATTKISNSPEMLKSHKDEPPQKNNLVQPTLQYKCKDECRGKIHKTDRKHFPAGHKLNKIFNKNSIKVSYSCMKNMNAIIKSHNNKLIHKLKQPYAPPRKLCNCTIAGDCPLRGNACRRP